MFEPGSVNGRRGALQIQTRTNQKHQNKHQTLLNGLDWKWQNKTLCTSKTRKATN